MVRVKAQTNEKGDNESMIDATVEGPALEISFYIRYLIEVLSVVKEDQMVIETNGPSDPGLFRPMTYSEDDSFTHVIMPMRGS
jgi:DNA polymerase III sliding clamp (beta) subunit (PCNA family)